MLDVKTANAVVSQVEPRMVIPSHYDTKGMNEKLANVEDFCKEIACAREDLNKLKMKKSALPVDDIQLVVLSKA